MPSGRCRRVWGTCDAPHKRAEQGEGVVCRHVVGFGHDTQEGIVGTAEGVVREQGRGNATDILALKGATQQPAP